MTEADQILYGKQEETAAPTSQADQILFGKTEQEHPEGYHPADAQIRPSTTAESLAMDWQNLTRGIFSAGPIANPFGSGPKSTQKTEGVKTEWSDLPHKVGGLVAEQALDPGNLLSIAGGRALGPTAESAIGRGFGGYMLYGSATGAKNLYNELKDPDVTAAQKTFDTFAYTLQTILGIGGVSGKYSTNFDERSKVADANAGTLQKPLIDPKDLHGQTPTALAATLQQAAAKAPPEQQELLKSAADQAQKIADMEPAAVKKLSAAAQAWDDVLKTVAPQARGDRAEITAQSLREHGAELAQRQNRAEAALKESSDILMKMDADKRWEAVDRIENREAQENEDLQGFADTVRTIMDTKRDEIRALGTGKLEHFIDDYFPHIWKDPETAVDAFQKAGARAPLEGDKSFLKQRTIPTIAEGMELDLEPVSTNPVDLLMLKAHQMDKYITGQKWLQEMKDRDFVKFVRATEKPPAGYTKIDDNIATVYGNPSHPGAVQIEGYYVAPNEVAQVANNYLSPGLRGSPSFRAYLSVANSVNQFQLGFSAFHLGFTTMDVATSKLALALEYGVEAGRKASPQMAAKALKAAGGIPASPITNLLQGSKGMAEWMRPGSQGAEIAQIMEGLKKGGTRAKMDSFYQANLWKQMKGAIDAGRTAAAEGKKVEAGRQYATAALEAPFALIEKLGEPLMSYIVPRQKLGIAMDMMRLEMEKMGRNPDVDTVRKAAGKVVDSVDNRMGQMVYDNLFWKKWMKDISMATVRSVGWNIGTVREIGGGMKDFAKAGFAPVNEAKAPEFTHRMAYVVALPVMSTAIGSIYYYLQNGKAPPTLFDANYPTTGEVDPQGREVRMQFPNYIKDMMHYAHDPVGTVTGKVNPAIEDMREMLLNKDYYGQEIRHADDPFVSQLMQELTFASKQFEPIAFRNYETQAAAGQTAAEKAGAFVGVTRAPAWMGESDAERLAGELAGNKFKSADSPDSARVHQIQNAKQLLRSGKEDQANAILDSLQDADQLTDRQRQNVVNGTDRTYLENATAHLTIDGSESHGDLWRVFRAATPQERAAIADHVQRQIDRANIPEKDRDELQAQFDKLMPPTRNIDKTLR